MQGVFRSLEQVCNNTPESETFLLIHSHSEMVVSMFLKTICGMWRKQYFLHIQREDRVVLPPTTIFARRCQMLTSHVVVISWTRSAAISRRSSAHLGPSQSTPSQRHGTFSCHSSNSLFLTWIYVDANAITLPGSPDTPYFVAHLDLHRIMVTLQEFAV